MDFLKENQQIVFHWNPIHIIRKFWSFIGPSEKFWLIYLSLTYNHQLDTSYAADVCMGPMYWLVDNFTSTVGTILIFGVSSLTASVVLIAYYIGIPYWWNKNMYICVCLVIFGHWILLNIIFNYVMACKVSPGYPPEGKIFTEAVSICKKCIAPKPPRTHHCSVCNRCILKMDHHCPWINNCVGFYNHRYFYMYMIYTVVGVFFVILAGWEIAYNELFGNDIELEGHSVKLNSTGAYVPVTGAELLDPVFLEEHELFEQPSQSRRRCIMYMALLNVGVFIALGALATWHGLLITRNETSIEVHINKSETIRLNAIGKTYINPYNLGYRNNWRHFFGAQTRRNMWMQLLLPSVFQPFGDGLTWPSNPDLPVFKRKNYNLFDSIENYVHSKKPNIFKKCKPR
ncbi:palmitoyltransferase ZDHHC16B isoform X2 [Anthonomus grandis grandis]|uniref:palmitoyltransferase ZDHHC16B isoform X2 n=1 Tax=Anthonomus grandis grandis TaxID=2921223 RepID=UPI0021666FA1|nr:palmitoyltransferase ZDHHC16B isoform X2 [Anthonomus grandis grandis]